MKCAENKTNSYLKQKINFKVLFKNQLGPARRAKISGICFSQSLNFQPSMSILSTLVFLLLKVWICSSRYVIRAWSSDFNLSSDLQLWISCIHQSCTACAFLGEELIRLSGFGAGDFILLGLITCLKICHMPSYGWAMVTKTVHQLKLLRLPTFDDHSTTMAQVITIDRKYMTT